ncbi:hypothetical protein E3P99_03495 [Wallemia hederae]|uniref:Ribosomal protein S15 n=1 Tax=Wallemia hederae TaxID=1540922 RepID=A0A4T0FGC4_9BASI|nr:hypothetical protein E3P99_03495 [Wallemia hederae]
MSFIGGFSGLRMGTSRSFSSSAVQLVSKRKQTSRLKKKQNVARKQSVIDAESSNLPSPALGYAAGQEDIWHSSELAAITLTPEQVYNNHNGVSGKASLSEITGVAEDKDDVFPGIQIPKLLNAPMSKDDLVTLFRTLPSLSAQRGAQLSSIESDSDAETIIAHEKSKLETFARLIDLRNASAKGIMLENIRRCIAAFGDNYINQSTHQPTHQGDSGKVEVQAAILTTRIRAIVSHLLLNTRDIQNKRSLSQLIQQRAKLLKYLKAQSNTRYESVLPRLGLTAKAIEMEIKGKLI